MSIDICLKILPGNIDICDLNEVIWYVWWGEDSNQKPCYKIHICKNSVECAHSNVDFDGKFFHTRHIWVVLPSSFSSFWLSFWSLDSFPQYMRRTQTFFSSCTFFILRVPFSIKISRIKKDWQNCEVCKPSESKMATRFQCSILLIAFDLSTEQQTTPRSGISAIALSKCWSLNWGIEFE